MMKSYPEHY